MNLQKCLREIEKIVGKDNFSDDEAILYGYSSDVSSVEGTPIAVARPGNSQEVARIVKACAAAKVPVIPSGGRTGAAGGAVAVQGGIIIDLTRMDDILEIDTQNLQVLVQPGVILDNLNAELGKRGFFFPVMPGSKAMATIGGVVANDASGMRAFKYGTAKDHVLGMKVVLPDGEEASLGGKPLKNVAGYDLVRLFAGSEGTLGIITELRLKILPVPPAKGVLVASFDDIHVAGRAAIETYQQGIVPSAMEILDKSALEAIKIYRPGLDIEIHEAMLLYEFEGNEQYVEFQADMVGRMLDAMGVTKYQYSANPREMEQLWNVRSIVGASASVIQEGYNRVYSGEDICVPLTEIPATLLKLREIKDKYGLGCLIFGHISIGSLHPAITIRKSEDEDWNKVRKMAKEIHEWALSVGGTVTGEHGIGVARKEYMERLDPQAVALMKKIKQAIDPDNIMNPGKVI